MASNFRKGLMASEDVRSLLVTGAYVSGGARAICPDGAVVVIGDLVNSSVYTSVLDLNVHSIAAPAAITDSVAIVDYDGISQGTIQGVVYRDGVKTYGLAVPADRTTRVRRLIKGDTGWFGSSNFASTPTVGQYAIPTASATTWTPAASAVTTSTCIKIESSKPVTEGAVNTDTEYFCTFVNVL